MKIIKLILINFSIFIACVLLLEFSIIKFNKNKIKCSYVLCNYNVTYKNTLYEPLGNINYKKDKFGFRGRIKDVSEIDVLVFGGSTTDERYLNLEDKTFDILLIVARIIPFASTPGCEKKFLSSADKNALTTLLEIAL